MSTTAAEPKATTKTTSSKTDKIDPNSLPPVDEKGELDTGNAEAAAVAVEKANFPEVDAREFEFGGLTFKVRQLTLKRERTFLKLFPVLQRPFDRIRELQESRGADSPVSVGEFLVETLSKEGDDVIDVLMDICAASLDNAKPASLKEHIDGEWISENLSLTQMVDVVSAQITEQSWGNFFQRVAALTGSAAARA